MTPCIEGPIHSLPHVSQFVIEWGNHEPLAPGFVLAEDGKCYVDREVLRAFANLPVTHTQSSANPGTFQAAQDALGSISEANFNSAIMTARAVLAALGEPTPSKPGELQTLSPR